MVVQVKVFVKYYFSTILGKVGILFERFCKEKKTKG